MRRRVHGSCGATVPGARKSPRLTRRESSGERDLRYGALLGLADLEVLGSFEAEIVGNQIAGEVLAGVVVAEHGVIERLASERNFVLRRRQLFLQLKHVLI